MKRSELKEIIKETLKEQDEKVNDYTFELKVRTWGSEGNDPKILNSKQILKILSYGLDSALNNIISIHDLSMSIEGNNLPK